MVSASILSLTGLKKQRTFSLHFRMVVNLLRHYHLSLLIQHWISGYRASALRYSLLTLIATWLEFGDRRDPSLLRVKRVYANHDVVHKYYTIVIPYMSYQGLRFRKPMNVTWKANITASCSSYGYFTTCSYFRVSYLGIILSTTSTMGS